MPQPIQEQFHLDKDHQTHYRPERRHARRFLRLGASLYVPGNHHQLVEIGNRNKFPHLRSVIICTEDSVRAEDIPFVLRNIEDALTQFDRGVELMRYIRVRSPELLAQCLQMNGIRNIDGFVLPKVTAHNLKAYLYQFRREDPFEVMATLETPEAFDYAAMLELRGLLLEPGHHERILSLRIGGNDLLNLLGLRRSNRHTVYDTPLAHTICMLVSVFKPYGFNLTGPVCDYMHATELIRRECELDLAHGLFGKTAIHPDQLALIESHYRVTREDLATAEALLAPDAPAVFRMYDAMCEPATHANWAEQVIARAEIYGVAE